MLAAIHSANCKRQFGLTPFFLALGSGAVVGAFTARLLLSFCISRDPSGLFHSPSEVFFIRRLLLTSLFPFLVILLSFSGHPSLAAVAFFVKGFFTSMILCTCAGYGFFPERAAVYRALFFRNILSFPVCFYTLTACLSSDTVRTSRLTVRLIVLNLVTVFVLLGAEAVIGLIF